MIDIAKAREFAAKQEKDRTSLMQPDLTKWIYPLCDELEKLRKRIELAESYLSKIAETGHGYGSDCHCSGCAAQKYQRSASGEGE